MDAGPVAFVATSAVRRETLAALASEERATDGLLDTVDASASAVYAALDELEDRGLVQKAADSWQLTGTGRIAADTVVRNRRAETVMTEIGDYLETHDCSVLPWRFRLRIGALAGATVIEATGTEPNRAVSAVARRLRTADRARVVSPIYVESYAEAMPDVPGSKLLVDEAVLTSAAGAAGSGDAGGDGGTAGTGTDGDAPGETPYRNVDMRVGKVGFALCVADRALLLSLPLLDGEYDARSELVVEDERAREWGVGLFAHCWDRASPVADLPADSAEHSRMDAPES
jgi:predicted transcriptional regulator